MVLIARRRVFKNDGSVQVDINNVEACLHGDNEGAHMAIRTGNQRSDLGRPPLLEADLRELHSEIEPVAKPMRGPREPVRFRIADQVIGLVQAATLKRGDGRSYLQRLGISIVRPDCSARY